MFLWYRQPGRWTRISGLRNHLGSFVSLETVESAVQHTSEDPRPEPVRICVHPAAVSRSVAPKSASAAVFRWCHSNLDPFLISHRYSFALATHKNCCASNRLQRCNNVEYFHWSGQRKLFMKSDFSQQAQSAIMTHFPC